MKKTKHLLLCTTLICSSILAETSSKIFEEARAGNAQAIKNRINNSEDLSKTDSDGNTILHVAAEQGYTEIVDELTTEPDYSGWGSWLYGFIWEVKLPSKNAKNKKGKTALHNAIENNQINAAEKLLIKNADTTITDDENLTPIFAAIKKDNPNFLPLFLKHRLIEQTINGENMLHYSIRNKKLTMITNLAQNKNLAYQENGQGYTPAMLATIQPDITQLKLLKENGIALDSCNRAGRQPIHAAAYAPNTESTKYLLENGAFVDATDNDGNTPLLHSVMAGNKTGMEFFLAYKANAKKTNTQGKGIVTLAVENKRHEILKRLKDHPDVILMSVTTRE
jgi:ankyrin repeat protein